MKNVSNTLKEIVLTLVELVAMFLVCIFLFTYVIFPCKVDGTSMENTLIDKDLGFSSIISRYFDVERFDVVVLDVNDDAQKYLVKRVIGLPGETVEYKDNCLYINGEYIEEPFVHEDGVTKDLKITLGENEYYCLGDNRSVSRDSRYYGPFVYRQITSVHFVCLYPFKHFGVY